jgi:hypothetical protein
MSREMASVVLIAPVIFGSGETLMTSGVAVVAAINLSAIVA